MSDEWTVVCRIDASSADLASLFLFDANATAVSHTELENTVELRAGFLDEAQAHGAIALLEQRLPTATCHGFLDSSRNEWVVAQRSSLSTTTIGEWTIRAPWLPVSNLPEHDIVIDPGAAFGHGSHHSTRLAAELILQTLEPGDTLVDLGTGTGVLSILAAKAGATVRATEIDPVAVEVAAQNIERNGVTGQVELLTGDATLAEVSATDIVVANVTLDIHRRLAPTYALANQVIVAGILCNQVASIKDLFERHRAATVTTAAEWAAIDFRVAPDHLELPKTGRLSQ